MPLNDEKKKIIVRAVIRLIRKNSGSFHLIGTVVKGFFSGNVTRKLLAPVFDFDPELDLPLEVLVAESVINALEEEDIEELFRRYASRKGLHF